jgi:hypothetical protein
VTITRSRATAADRIEAGLRQLKQLTIVERSGDRVPQRYLASYNWAYVIAPDRVGTLLTLLGGHVGDEVLDLLAAYHDQHGRKINDLLRSSQVAATFNNWHR